MPASAQVALLIGTGLQPPSSMDEFERSARPQLFPGLVSAWPALTAWRPEYLCRVAGNAAVNVMVSDAPGGVFWGDIARHHPLTCSLGQFFDLATSSTRDTVHPVYPAPSTPSSSVSPQPSAGQLRGRPLSESEAASPHPPPAVSETRAEVACSAEPSTTDGAGSRHFYLAQQPLEGGLVPLLGDVPRPGLLCGRAITQTNLWISANDTRCATLSVVFCIVCHVQEGGLLSNCA